MMELFVKIVNGLFLYPLKMLEHERFPDVFRGVQKCIKPLLFLQKSSARVIWRSPNYTSAQLSVYIHVSSWNYWFQRLRYFLNANVLRVLMCYKSCFMFQKRSWSKVLLTPCYFVIKQTYQSVCHILWRK